MCVCICIVMCEECEADVVRYKLKDARDKKASRDRASQEIITISSSSTIS